MQTRSAIAASTAAALIFSLLAIPLAKPASATLIDLVVVGEWASVNNPIKNPFGFVIGGKFVMKATYDDTTFFNGPQGVTAYVDPLINPGTSLEIIFPHAGPAPNPVTFDHTDHTAIPFSAPCPAIPPPGFCAQDAEIEFDGPDANTPGNFRNFEWHIDGTYAGDDIDYDQYQGALNVVTEIYNIGQGGDLAAVGVGPGSGYPLPHLNVVTNDITANAGGPYVFSAGSLSLNTGGSSGGGSGFPKVFDWTGPGGALANSPGANIAFDLAESGLANAGDSSIVSLAVTELYTDFASPSDDALVTYSNVAPVVTIASGVTQTDFSITFSATATDGDLAANAPVPGFEVVTVEFLYNSNVFLNGGGNLNFATLFGIFAGTGIFSVDARATDLAGATHTLSFNVTIVECFGNRACSDGEFCNGTELCVADLCQPGAGSPCIGVNPPFCDEVNDVCVHCLVNGDCDDGLFCTGTETCSNSGFCFSSGDPCAGQDPLCDESANVCVECFEDKDCVEGEVCSSGSCGPLALVPASSSMLRLLLVSLLLAIALASPLFLRSRER